MYRCVRPRPRAQSASIARPSRLFSVAARLQTYAETLPNLRIGKHTRVIFQGFTGKQATVNARESIAWGTKIVGGVTPGRTGEHLGLPVLPTVREAVRLLRPDATAIYVAAHQAPGAIEEAIEAEVPLIVAVAEHIPLHDMLRIHSILKTQSKSRLVGPNSPGIISAVGRCRIGFQPLLCFSPGRVGIIAKSGTLSYETVASTTRAGLGQSLCIGVGGDILLGTDLWEALSVLEHDEDTHAIALIGEIGGTAELDAAVWIKDYHSRVASPKPIVGLVAGINEVRHRIMGHAGAFTIPGEPNAKEKIDALSLAGVTIVNHPSKIGDVLKLQLSSGWAKRPGSTTIKTINTQQHRQLSTGGRRPGVQPYRECPGQHRRHLYLTGRVPMDMLRETGQVSCDPDSRTGVGRTLGIGIDRSTRSPCVIARSPFGNSGSVKRFPFEFQRGPDELNYKRIADHLQVSSSQNTVSSLRQIIGALKDIFYEKEAFLLTTKIVEGPGALTVVDAWFGFDDAAFRVGGRQKAVHELRNLAVEDASEFEAEKSGIVYLKLEGNGTIGTLVNGAGLAMNTVDALADSGGMAANFLDTGGKATSETVKRSFEIILQDPGVRVIFVNIFGGLTLGDMIARGIIMAFKDLSLKIPVVVRIRGTNEKEGQALIAESGLPLYAFDDFDDACTKAIELSRER